MHGKYNGFGSGKMMRILWIWIRIRNIASKSSSLLTCGESNCHGFYNFCVLQFMYFSLFSSSISCCPIQLWGCQKIKREGRRGKIFWKGENYMNCHKQKLLNLGPLHRLLSYHSPNCRHPNWFWGCDWRIDDGSRINHTESCARDTTTGCN